MLNVSLTHESFGSSGEDSFRHEALSKMDRLVQQNDEILKILTERRPVKKRIDSRSSSEKEQRKEKEKPKTAIPVTKSTLFDSVGTRSGGNNSN